TTSDTGGGFNVGWIANTEYLEYTVDVTEGEYNVHVRVASLQDDPADIRLLIGDGPEGTNFTELGTFAVESTGAWQNWATVSLGNVDLAPHAGDGKVLRLEMIGNHLNINWLEFETSTPPNEAPSVDAGLDASTAVFTNHVDGTVTDDGLPNPPAAVTTTWTKQSGPGNVTFGDAGSIDTTARFDAPGVYTLRLAADDGEKQSFDEVLITVTPLPGDANGDGSVDVSDLGTLATNYGTSSGAEWGDGDFNFDGKVNQADLSILVSKYGQTIPSATVATAAIAPQDPCDLDHDGQVGLGDLAFFSSVYGEQPGITTESPYAYAADFDGNGTVDLGDLGIFSSHYRQEPPESPVVDSADMSRPIVAAPEPSLTAAAVTRDEDDFCDRNLSDEDVAMLARHWLMAVEDIDDDERDAVFAEVDSRLLIK
ncbi:MAG: carbohydrate-binding protein, partial [Pirellulales bacterium]|nr:carbohydrate-binding protein [Pirellulales bacterium]